MVLSSASSCVEFLFFFFFQAEDGIRDKLVTGVQTCALPISLDFGNAPFAAGALRWLEVAVRTNGSLAAYLALTPRQPLLSVPRSEERRVGKECRSRWSPYH